VPPIDWRESLKESTVSHVQIGQLTDDDCEQFFETVPLLTSVGEFLGDALDSKILEHKR
jgi:hypothetical protein